MDVLPDQKKYLIVLAGPTAVGKTDLAIKIASLFQTEIISADSRQFFKEMHIGTAVPEAKQLNKIKHHYIQNLSVNDVFDVATYESKVLQLLEKLFLKHQVVVITGGSGLYILFSQVF